MLDSGAFSVWNKGISIDLDAYITYCLKHPYIAYYVNLDVIPGSVSDMASLSSGAISKACEEGWKNYLTMLKKLPIGKVIPVFHQGDDYKWIKKYIDHGCTYIGISPSNDRTTKQKVAWLKEVQQHIGDKKGNPIIRTH